MAEAQIGKLPEKPKEELIYDENYKHSLTASSYSAQTSFLSNVSGSPMLTEYYRQVLGGSEEPHTIQPESIETYQSYTRIKGMIIKVDGDKSPNFDDEYGIMGENGVAYVLADLAPIIYDVFIADIGDGKTGLYHIPTAPRIRAVTMDKVYEIDFKLIAIMNARIEENLTKKVIEELIYSKDSAIRGGNAVLTKTDYYSNADLSQLETLIAQSYVQDFYYEPEKTIIVPVEATDSLPELRYDPYLARFMQFTLPSRRLGMRDGINVIGTDFGNMNRGGKKITVWDMFLQNNFKSPKQYQQKLYLHPRDAVLNTRYYGGFYYCKLDTVILNEEYAASKEAYRFSGPLLFNNTINFEEEFPGKPGEPYEDYFSDEFYEGKPTRENEKFIFDFFRDKTVDKEKLLKILKGYWDLPDIDRFYMAGIYLHAIKISLSTTYNYL